MCSFSRGTTLSRGGTRLNARLLNGQPQGKRKYRLGGILEVGSTSSGVADKFDFHNFLLLETGGKKKS